MPRSVRVHFLPRLFEPSEVAAGIAVIVDILRASTTITHALANGAARIVPCASIEDALALWHAEDENVILGGERGGVRIDGFDLTNSPDDYTRDMVEDSTIGFTTTNGTKAMLASQLANEIIVGCFANLTAVINRVSAADSPLHIVCAGTDGAITGEDVLFAGAMISRLNASRHTFCDSSMIALSYWNSAVKEGTSAEVESAMYKCQGGRNLARLGYTNDIKTASQIDSVPTIGVLGSNGIQAVCH